MQTDSYYYQVPTSVYRIYVDTEQTEQIIKVHSIYTLKSLTNILRVLQETSVQKLEIHLSWMSKI